MRRKGIPIDTITITDGRRAISSHAVDELSKSIAEVGLLNPIVVTMDGRLVAGAHRLEACRRLGWTTIPAAAVELDALHAELAEIDENLVRNELSVLERSESLKRRKEIYEAIHPEAKAKTAGAHASNRAQGRGASEIISPAPSFAADTAAKTGRTPRTIQHEVQIAEGIAEPVRDQIRGTPLANKKAELIKLARLEPEKQQAVATSIVESGGKLTVVEASRAVKRDEQRQMSAQEPTGKFRVVYSDPPWSYSNGMPDGATTPRDYYDTMSLDEICAMPVREWIENDAVLFLWVTSPHLRESFKVIDAWGFKYKTSFVWDKVLHNMGHYNSVRHEFLLVCTRGACTPDVRKLFDSVVTEERTQHSVKPDVFYEIIETLYPHGRRLEMFQRRAREGWVGTGLEAPGAP